MLNGFAARLAVIGLAVACAFTPPPAGADALGDAVQVINQASDAELLAELQRRQDARRMQPPPPDYGMTGRDIKTGLGQIDDATFVQALRVSQEAKPRAIYGPDNRKDWHEIKDEAVERLASAAAALFSTSDVRADASGAAKLSVKLLGEKQLLAEYASERLCKGEPFANQVSGAFCSGTLVKEDEVLTAGHCVREVSGTGSYVTAISFVFGYRVEQPGSPGTTVIPQAQIFKGRRVVGGELADNGRKDWALVKLDRPVPASIARPVTAWRASDVALGQGVVVIGYPSGLPLKYAPDGKVRSVADPAFFTATLDTFAGNSGSGVFDAATQELVGVLVRGEADYVKDVAGCLRTYKCPASGCSNGEAVTRIGLVKRQGAAR